MDIESPDVPHSVVCPACNNRIELPASVASDVAARGSRIPPDLVEGEAKSADDVERREATIDQYMSKHGMTGGVEILDGHARRIANDVLTSEQKCKYEVGRTIKQGGMGAILDAKDVNIRRNVAMKVMLNPEEASRKQVVRFIEEAQITGQLEHPGIVPVYELGVDGDGNVFYTMKFVSGLTLKDILLGIKAGDKDMIAGHPLSHLLIVFQKVCDAVAFAHSRKVIHRDLKPENIMVGEYGEVQVMDWGLAKPLVESSENNRDGRVQVDSIRLDSGDVQMTMAGALVGTPSFASPEQVSGKSERVDERTDIYALGGILYNILSLQPPVTGCSLEEALRRVRSGDIMDLAEYNGSFWQSRSSRRKSTARRKKEPGTAAITPTMTIDASSDQEAEQEAPPSTTPVSPTEPASEADAPDAVPPDTGKRDLLHCPGGRIPASLAAVAMKALALNPSRRYQTVKELQNDIEAYQNGFVTSAEEANLWKLLKLFVKRHKVVTYSSLILLVVIAVSGSVNYLERLRRQKERKKSAPSLVENAKVFAENGSYQHALTSVDTAIEYDKSLADGHLVRAMLLMRKRDYREAFRECKAYLNLHSNSADVQRLAEICRDATMIRNADLPSGELATIVARQGMPVLAAEFLDSAKHKLTLYREKIEKAWPSLGSKLTLTEEGTFCFRARRIERVADLSLLQGIPLSEVFISHCPVADLTPLKGMKLTKLDISGTQVKDLSPLKGMPLKELTLSEGFKGCPVSDLSPLKGMQLSRLDISGTKVRDISPLKGMRLTWMELTGTEVADLSPLQGMPLIYIGLSDGWLFCPVRDIAPLRGMQLTRLDLSMTHVSNLEPLKGMPLVELMLLGCIGVDDISPLKGMSLTRLNLRGLKSLTSLDPLTGMRPTSLDISGCEGISSLAPLMGMPLATLDLTGCRNITDLAPLTDLPLASLQLDNRYHIEAGTQGLRALRSMTSLAKINGKPAEQFWEEYDSQAGDD